MEIPEVAQPFAGNSNELERELELMARRKSKFVVSMQQYSKFNKEEHENAEFLLRAYPEIQITYIEESPKKEGGDPRLFSALIDGHSEFDIQTGKRQPKFRIELPSNPILGDGKSDSRNHAITFYRGEYLQLIDANQENYLEECLKIRNILGEFEEHEVSTQSTYAHRGHKDFKKSPVAIAGAREYIFSENIGVLGDLAAGKEQTFGTLVARWEASLWPPRLPQRTLHGHSKQRFQGAERTSSKRGYLCRHERVRAWKLHQVLRVPSMRQNDIYEGFPLMAGPSPFRILHSHWVCSSRY